MHGRRGVVGMLPCFDVRGSAMISPGSVFYKRLKHYGSVQLKVWGSVLDWTVWIYIAIPGLLIGGGLYRDLWREMPGWASVVSWPLALLAVMVGMMGFFRIRTFVEEADRLFLLQRPAWLRLFKRFGMIFSFLKQAVLLLLPNLLLLPFLLKDSGMTLVQVLALYVYSLVIGYSLSIAVHLVVDRVRGWRKGGLHFFLWLVAALGYFLQALMLKPGTADFIVMWAVSGLIFIILLVLALRTGVRYEEEVKREREARLGSTALLMSQVVPAKPVVRLKRPIWFRGSGRLFRKKADSGTILAEMRIKSFLRTPASWQIWPGYLSLTTYASTLVPPSASFVLIAGFLIMGVSWLRMQWEQWYKEEFIGQFRWEYASSVKAVRLSRFWLLLPHITVWSLVAGYRLAGVWFMLPISLAVCAIWWLFHRTRG
ncbi:ABC transporter permease [Paenibacillus sp. GCM10027627]|uniref:ABC transporter permease n=1 Tax=unclassified Paenibacillus TaxID=185978 RepID=UPI0036309E0F